MKDVVKKDMDALGGQGDAGDASVGRENWKQGIWQDNPNGWFSKKMLHVNFRLYVIKYFYLLYFNF